MLASPGNAAEGGELVCQVRQVYTYLVNFKWLRY